MVITIENPVVIQNDRTLWPREHDTIIVLVKYQGTYTWCVTPHEYWFMDLAKYKSEFGEDDPDYSDRFDIPVLSETTAGCFLDQISGYVLTKEEMQDTILALQPLKYWGKAAHLFPTLFVDFDDRQLYSVYGEIAAFENYVPFGWEGSYQDFYALIPDQEKYWIIDGLDCFDQLM